MRSSRKPSGPLPKDFNVDLTSHELGLSLGYASESAFSNAFKRTAGMAPKRYRSIFCYGLGSRVGDDAPESLRSRTCVASTKSKRTVPSLNVSPAWNALSLNV